nr:protein ACCELERATED CELL DEATH 6 [Ipomoea batatas]
MAAPRALTGWTGVRKIMMDETITEIRFMVFPILKVKGEISSRDIDPQSPRDEHYQRPSSEGERGGQPGKRVSTEETWSGFANERTELRQGFNGGRTHNLGAGAGDFGRKKSEPWIASGPDCLTAEIIIIA